jgi:hypothetical protein
MPATVQVKTKTQNLNTNHLGGRDIEETRAVFTSITSADA